MTHVAAVFDVSHYRIRDDSAGLNVDSGWLAALDTTYNPTVDTDFTFRVRFEIEETAGATSPTSPGGVIECSHNGGSYFGVNASSTIVVPQSSSQFTNEDATTNLLAGSSRTFDTGRGSTDGAVDGQPTLSDEHTEYEYCLRIVAADVANNDTLAFRIAGPDTNTTVPTMTVAKTPVTLLAGLGGVKVRPRQAVVRASVM